MTKEVGQIQNLVGSVFLFASASWQKKGPCGLSTVTVTWSEDLSFASALGGPALNLKEALVEGAEFQFIIAPNGGQILFVGVCMLL